MKKNLFYLMLVTIGFLTSCKKDTDPIFEDTDARLTAELAADQAKLLSAENGWKAVIYPKGGKGFLYYLKFTADGKVVMLSDFNETSATIKKESTYRLKAMQRPTLIFDSYNYIHLAADPDASISGAATNSTGLISDFEFGFIKVSADSLTFEGTFNGNEMKMSKLSATEAQSILDGGLKTMTTANATYLNVNRNPYLSLADGINAALLIDPTTKTIALSYLDAQGLLHSQTVKFTFGINQLILSTNLVYGNSAFGTLLYDPANKIYYILNGTSRIEVKNSPTPLTPLSSLFGYPASFTYRTISIPSTGLPTGVTSGFTSVYNTVLSNFVTSGRSVTSSMLSLTGLNTLRVTVNYASGTTAFVAYADYTFTRVGDTFTLSAPIYSSNWTTRATQLLPLTNYMLTGPFKIDWVSTTNTGNTNLLGGFYRTNDLSSFFYGNL